MENKELLEKARGASSPEELLALAKESAYQLDEESAKAYFEQLHQSGELSDEELDNVSGGGCHYKDGRLVTTVGNSCRLFLCTYCGRGLDLDGRTHMCTGGRIKSAKECNICKWMTYEHGLWLCNNRENYKK